MRHLVVIVIVIFVGVTAVSLTRWLSPNTIKDDVGQQAAPAPEMDWGASVARENSSSTNSIVKASSGEFVPLEHASEAVASIPTELALGLKMGFTHDEALALIRHTNLEQLEAFFAQHSHITADWLNQNGLSAEHMRELYARWAAGTPPEAAPVAPGALMFSRYSPHHVGGPYRIQNNFSSADRTVFLHYQLPRHYQQASVIIRWTRQDQSGLTHFDYHSLTDDPNLRQEAWVRPREGWDPGTYRVEIYGTEPSLPLIAQRDYEVLP